VGSPAPPRVFAEGLPDNRKTVKMATPSHVPRSLHRAASQGQSEEGRLHLGTPRRPTYRSLLERRRRGFRDAVGARVERTCLCPAARS